MGGGLESAPIFGLKRWKDTYIHVLGQVIHPEIQHHAAFVGSTRFVDVIDFPDPTARAAREGEESYVVRTVLAHLFWCMEFPVEDGAIESLGCRRARVRGFSIRI
jgi:hypothetical protein